jgi:hypothetical protein
VTSFSTRSAAPEPGSRRQHLHVFSVMPIEDDEDSPFVGMLVVEPHIRVTEPER